VRKLYDRGPPSNFGEGVARADQPPVGASEAPVSEPPLSPPLEVPPSWPASVAPPSVVPPSPGLQTLIGSVGAAASGPQVSPAVKQSADVPHSWIGPMAVDGHGPAWHIVVIEIVPQQTSPVGQSDDIVHATALLSPPPEDDELDEDDDPVPVSSVVSASASGVVFGLELLLQPDANAKPTQPALRTETKRIFEFCMGNIPPPEVTKSAGPYTGPA